MYIEQLEAMYICFIVFFCWVISFGVIPTTPLAMHTPLMPSQSIDISLPLNTIGPVMKMDPLNNLQVQCIIAFCHEFL